MEGTPQVLIRISDVVDEQGEVDDAWAVCEHSKEIGIFLTSFSKAHNDQLHQCGYLCILELRVW